MKRFEAAMTGFFVGALLGGLAGLGEIRMLKKSQRTGLIVGFVVGATVLAGAFTGAHYALKWDREEKELLAKAEQEKERKRIEMEEFMEKYREEQLVKQEMLRQQQEAVRLEKERQERRERFLGINDEKTDYFKQGRFWVGATRWQGENDETENRLLTFKNEVGRLVTFLNDTEYIQHPEWSASQTTVPKYHYMAKQQVFAQLREAYQETSSML